MADVRYPTAIKPLIPTSDISRFERFLLSKFFEEYEDAQGMLYYHAKEGYDDRIAVTVADILNHADPRDLENRTLSDQYVDFIVGGEMEQDKLVNITLPKEELIELLQQIVIRSSTVDRIDVVSSYVSDKVHPDLLGGSRIIVLADSYAEIDTSEEVHNLFPEDDDEPISADAIAFANLVENISGLALKMHGCLNQFANLLRPLGTEDAPWVVLDEINEEYHKLQIEDLAQTMKGTESD